MQGLIFKHGRHNMCRLKLGGATQTDGLGHYSASERIITCKHSVCNFQYSPSRQQTNIFQAPDPTPTTTDGAFASTPHSTALKHEHITRPTKKNARTSLRRPLTPVA